MCPIVSIVSGGEFDPGVFISLENIPIVLANLQRALPQLRNALRRRWFVQSIEVENRRPRFRNPFDPSLIVPAGVGLLITFGAAAAKAAGTEFGKVAGTDIAATDIAAYVRRWIRRLPTKKTSTAIRSRKPTQRKSKTRSRR
jgi:hypothetical protein